MRMNRTPIDELTCERVKRVDGRVFDLWSDGTLLPVVRGGDGEDDDAGGAGGDGGTGGGSGDDGQGGAGGGNADRTFTQDELNQKIQERLRKDREAREKQLAEKLKGKSLDDVLAAADEHQAKLDESLTEGERKLAEATRKEQIAEESTRKAAHAELRADSVTALVLAGVNPKRVTRAAEMMLGDLQKLDTIEDDSIATTVATLKEEFPELFDSDDAGGDGDPEPKGRANTLGGRQANGTGDQKTGVDAGRERARKERASNGDGERKELFEGLRPLGSMS